MTDPAAAGTAKEVACPSCGEPALAADVFCESCGAPLHPDAGEHGGTSRPGTEQGVASRSADEPALSCASCGGTEFADGYCSNCGAPAVRERDHWSEQPAPWLAAVCDRGIRHHRNEDAVALAVSDGSTGVLVVCDGVSSSTDSDLASLAAARAARDVLAAAPPGSAWPRLLAQAADAANQQVLTVTTSANAASPPSCTFVAAVVDGRRVVAGWVGDSRAYWLPDADPQGAQQLSLDDSWAAEAIAAGMPREDAESAPRAHAITRWLGQDAPDHAPRITEIDAGVPGWLLVCSDGLWNYCSAAASMHGLVNGFGVAEPRELSDRLVEWANRQGGQDNITVALARLGPAPEATPEVAPEANTRQRQET